MTTIPASQLVSVNPSVISAGGDALDVIGLLLTTSSRVPIGDVRSFASSSAVSDFFGASSQEAALALNYFAGFDNSAVKPGSVLFSQYNETAVAAWLRGGSLADMTLAELQALSGSLDVIFDGYERDATSINLSGSASFSAAAATIQTALNAAAPNAASVTGSIAGTTLTVTAVSSGALADGQTVTGTGPGVPAGLVILDQLSGSVGGTGTYLLSGSGTVSSRTLIGKATDLTVTYDSVSNAFLLTSGVSGEESTAEFATGTLAASLNLTDATGADVSQGAEAAEPGPFMSDLVEVTTDWVTFMTTFDPDDSGSDVKQAFAAWNSSQNKRYAYICWDLDQNPVTEDPAETSLGQILDANGDSGTCLLGGIEAAGWDDETAPALAAFVCGAAASIDFEQTNGRITFAYKAQSGIVGTVTNGTAAANLGGNPQTSDRGNGYNFYGAYGAANAGYIWFQRGFVTGAFLWLDSYINQIWLNSAFQLALLTLLQNSRSVPYDVTGRSAIEASLTDPINAGLNFGAFAPGTISESQKQAVNTQAGLNIADSLQSQGFYLQVKDATSTARAARSSPPATFWYLDRGSVQAINLASVAVQ